MAELGYGEEFRFFAGANLKKGDVKYYGEQSIFVIIYYKHATLIEHLTFNRNFHKKKFWFFKNALKIKKFNFQIQIGLFSTFCMIEWKHTLFTGHLKTLHFCIKRIHELLTLMENSFQKGGLLPLQYFTLINFQTFNFDTKKP